MLDAAAGQCCLEVSKQWALHSKLQMEQKRRRILQVRLASQHQELALVRRDVQALRPWQSHNSYFDRVPPFRGVVLAFKRTIANIAASKLGAALSSDVHGTTVSKWEIKASAALTFSAQAFHAYVFTMISTCQMIFEDWALIGIRRDATNAAVWQRQKLHCLEVSLVAKARHML